MPATMLTIELAERICMTLFEVEQRFCYSVNGSLSFGYLSRGVS